MTPSSVDLSRCTIRLHGWYRRQGGTKRDVARVDHIIVDRLIHDFPKVFEAVCDHAQQRIDTTDLAPVIPFAGSPPLARRVEPSAFSDPARSEDENSGTPPGA